MPRKKQAKKTVKLARQTRTRKKVSTSSRVRWGDRNTKVNWTESYSSFLLGVVAIIIVVLFGVSIVRQQSHVKQTSSLSIGPTVTVAPSPTSGITVVENGNTYYVVKANDSLWTIAQTVYNNGYKWTDIAKANNLVNPGTIFTGNKLLIPNAPSPSELGTMLQKPSPTPMPHAITENTYTVQKDDTLWDIAVRAYADGYQWVKIAKANNLSDPDMIFSGNVLQIPR